MNLVALRPETPDSPRPHNRTPGDPCRNGSRMRNYPGLLGKTSQKGLTRMRVWRFRVAACTARVVCAGHTVPSQKRHDGQLEQMTSPAVTGRDKQHPAARTRLAAINANLFLPRRRRPRFVLFPEFSVFFFPPLFSTRVRQPENNSNKNAPSSSQQCVIVFITSQRGFFCVSSLHTTTGAGEFFSPLRKRTPKTMRATAGKIIKVPQHFTDRVRDNEEGTYIVMSTRRLRSRPGLGSFQSFENQVIFLFFIGKIVFTSN